ncbi:chaplin family protein [Streptomyces sp. NPDC058691]
MRPSAIRGGRRGALSGHVLQAPVTFPVGLCGNTVDVIGPSNPVSGESG